MTSAGRNLGSIFWPRRGGRSGQRKSSIAKVDSGALISPKRHFWELKLKQCFRYNSDKKKLDNFGRKNNNDKRM
jgi:hypothetical protein